MNTKPISQYPAGGPDWATVCRWEDAGRPSLNPDGTWDAPEADTSDRAAAEH